MEALDVTTRVTGTICFEQTAPTAVDWLLIGFHGYGENAASMLPRLRLPMDQRQARVAVQALHAFYVRGRPGYSWMTSDQRELRIADNLAYAERVLEEVRGRCSWQRVAWCGFSQGAPMAFRACARFGGHGLILNGGELPPGEDPSGLPPCLLGRGADDQHYTAADMERDRQRLQDHHIDCRTTTLAGGHEWNDHWMEACAAFLDRLS